MTAEQEKLMCYYDALQAIRDVELNEEMPHLTILFMKNRAAEALNPKP